MDEQYRECFSTSCENAAKSLLVAVKEDKPIPSLVSDELLFFIDNYIEANVIGTMNQILERKGRLFDFFTTLLMDSEIGEILYFHQGEELAEKTFKYLLGKNFTEDISCFEVIAYSTPLSILRFYEISKPYLKKYKIKDDVFSVVIEGEGFNQDVANYLDYCENNPELISDDTKKNLDGWIFFSKDLMFENDDFINRFIRAFGSVCEKIETVIIGSVINEVQNFYRYHEFKDEQKTRSEMEEEILPKILTCFESLKKQIPCFNGVSDKDYFNEVIAIIDSLINENEKEIEVMEEGYSRDSLMYRNRATKHIKDFLIEKKKD